jgi:hypothetical protein
MIAALAGIPAQRLNDTQRFMLNAGAVVPQPPAQGGQPPGRLAEGGPAGSGAAATQQLPPATGTPATPGNAAAAASAGDGLLTPITGGTPAAGGGLHQLGNGSGGPTASASVLTLLDSVPMLPGQAAAAAAAAAAPAAPASAAAEAAQVTPNGRSGGGSDSGGPTPDEPTLPLPNGHALPGVSAGAAPAGTQTTLSTVDKSGGAGSGSPEQAAHQPLTGSLAAPPASENPPQVRCPRPQRNILACVAGQILFATYSETCHLKSMTCHVDQQDSGHDSASEACLGAPVQWHAADLASAKMLCLAACTGRPRPSRDS